MQTNKLSIIFRSSVIAYNDTILYADKPYYVHYMFKSNNKITLYVYDNVQCNTAIELKKGSLDESICTTLEFKTNSKVSFDLMLNGIKVHYKEISDLYDKLQTNTERGVDL